MKKCCLGCHLRVSPLPFTEPQLASGFSLPLTQPEEDGWQKGPVEQQVGGETGLKQTLGQTTRSDKDPSQVRKKHLITWPGKYFIGGESDEGLAPTFAYPGEERGGEVCGDRHRPPRVLVLLRAVYLSRRQTIGLGMWFRLECGMACMMDDKAKLGIAGTLRRREDQRSRGGVSPQCAHYTLLEMRRGHRYVHICTSCLPLVFCPARADSHGDRTFFRTLLVQATGVVGIERGGDQKVDHLLLHGRLAVDGAARGSVACLLWEGGEGVQTAWDVKGKARHRLKP